MKIEIISFYVRFRSQQTLIVNFKMKIESVASFILFSIRQMSSIWISNTVGGGEDHCLRLWSEFKKNIDHTYYNVDKQWNLHWCNSLIYGTFVCWSCLSFRRQKTHNNNQKVTLYSVENTSWFTIQSITTTGEPHVLQRNCTFTCAEIISIVIRIMVRLSETLSRSEYPVSMIKGNARAGMYSDPFLRIFWYLLDDVFCVTIVTLYNLFHNAPAIFDLLQQVKLNWMSYESAHVIATLIKYATSLSFMKEADLPIGIFFL